MERGGIGKEIAVLYRKATLVKADTDAAVIELDLLHFRRGSPVTAIDDAVSAEVIIGGTLAVVTAIGEEPLAITVLFPYGLVDIVPDEPALIVRLALCKVGVLVHGAAGVAHGMGVFTADQRLVRMLGKEGLYFRHGRVHAALQVAGLRIAGIPGDALIVNGTVRVELMEQAAHFKNDAAAVGLIAAGPHDHGRVVFITLIGGAHTVQQQGSKLHMILRNDKFGTGLAAKKRIPAAVGFHVVLVHDIDSVLVAELVKRGLIRIVRGADGIDIMLLHGNDVKQQLLAVRNTARDGAEVVTVDTVKNKAFAIEQQDAVTDFHTAETQLLGNDLGDGAVSSEHFTGKAVEVWSFCRPEQRRSNLQHRTAGVGISGKGELPGQNLPPALCETEAECAAPAGCGRKLKLTRLQRFIQQWTDRKVCDRCLGQHVEENTAEDPGEAEEILILKPTSGCPLVYPDGQAVFPGAERVGQTEIGRSKAVLTVADITAVQPECKAALNSLQGYADILSAKTFRQREGADIVADGVEDRGHFARLEFLTGIPGILGVDIGGNVIAFHLNMGRDADAVPAGDVKIRLPEPVRSGGRIAGIVKTPDPVQRHPERTLSDSELCGTPIGGKIGMGRETAVSKNGRVFHDGFKVKSFHTQTSK